MKSPRPYVLVNMAISADGKTASASRGVCHFSSRRDETHLYELRATVDAVLNGARTVDTSPVKMDPGPTRFRRLRIQRGLAEFNLRIIASAAGSIRLDAEVFHHNFSKIIVLTTRRCPKTKLEKLRERGVCLITSPDGELNFHTILPTLRREHGIHRLLCEGGGNLNDSLFRADLVDEVHLTVCPLLIGGRSAPTIADGEGFKRLQDTTSFELIKRRSQNGELFLTYRRKK